MSDRNIKRDLRSHGNAPTSRYGSLMTFKPDNVKTFERDLEKHLMRRPHVIHAHSTTYPPQTNGLITPKWTTNRTLVNMLRIVCPKFMTDCHKYWIQVFGAPNCTQVCTTGMYWSLHDAGRKRKGDAVDVFLPRVCRKKNALIVSERRHPETAKINWSLKMKNC